MKTRILSCLVLASLTICATATAQTTTESAATPTPAPEETRHKGFFLRAALGGGGVHDSFSVPFLIGSLDGAAEGPSGSFEISAGYAVRPGLIIGGGVYGEQVVNPKITFQGNPVASDVHVGTLVMVGPFIDWYPKAGNFHFGGALTAARITLQDNSNNIKDQSPVGGAVVAEVGYEFPFTDNQQWGLGLMLRFVGGVLKDNTYTHDVTAGSLLLNVTYN
jgi:hypothetical protein